MTTLQDLERAEEFVHKVGRRIGSRLAAVGIPAWTAPDTAALARERARTDSLLIRAARRVEAAEDRLVREGRATRAELTARRLARNAGFLSRAGVR